MKREIGEDARGLGPEGRRLGLTDCFGLKAFQRRSKKKKESQGNERKVSSKQGSRI